jgi:hypothetical protein
MAANDNPIGTNTGALGFGTSEPGSKRTEPLLTVDRFKAEYLFGIPLKSALTGEVITDVTLKNFIAKGVSDAETALRIPITPVRKVERFDFERADDLQLSTRRVSFYPVLKVEEFAALWPGRSDADPNNSQVITYPTEWVVFEGDTGLFRIVPVSGSFVNADSTFINSIGFKSVFLAGIKAWPSMWRMTYLAGFDFDRVPVIINDFIGICAAIKFLSLMGPVIFPAASYSIGFNGMSQSVATPGPAYLAQRLQELEQQKEMLTQQLKTHFGSDIFFTVF